MADAPSVARLEQQWNERQLAAPLRAPAWRLWRYDTPAVVLGCSQRRLMAGAQGRIDVLLRRSGGGAVLVGPWMLGLSVALPSTHAFVSASAAASYRWLGELLAQWLRKVGMHDARALTAKAAPIAAGAPDVGWACFGSLSPSEIVVHHRKIAGLAQVRCREGVLLVGGLLIGPPDWPLLTAALGRPAEDALALQRCTTSWAQQLGASPCPGAVARALADQLAERLGTDRRCGWPDLSHINAGAKRPTRPAGCPP